jgi:hypothetical protein
VGAFLKEPTRFDNLEFGIVTKDVLSMTASTRRLIELTFLACLDSGVDSRDKRIGVFHCKQLILMMCVALNYIRERGGSGVNGDQALG